MYDDEPHFCWQQCCDLGPHACICGNECFPSSEPSAKENERG